MRETPQQIIVECDATIECSPDALWGMLAHPQSAPARATVSGGGGTGSAGDVQSLLRIIRPSPGVFMEQRIVESDDRVMVMRFEITRSQGLPWSTYQATLRVEPRGPGESRVVLNCLVTPTDDRPVVTGILRGLMLLSLRSLKVRVEMT